MAVEAYSHEVSSCGFWPGGGPIDGPVFYAYAYPEPKGFSKFPTQPSEAFYHKERENTSYPTEGGQYSSYPDDVLLSFLQSNMKQLAHL